MTKFFNPQSMSPPFNPYSHGALVEAGSQILFLAGQVGSDIDGNIAADFEGQIRQTYANIETVLKEAGMDLGNIVKATTFLTSRAHLDPMREIRKEILGAHKPAHTLLIVSGLAYEEFLIEVECVAAL
jgi:2-iminobutanoate/2-iminopropanoate deaminase